jgi:hypothetical protein
MKLPNDWTSWRIAISPDLEIASSSPCMPSERSPIDPTRVEYSSWGRASQAAE